MKGRARTVALAVVTAVLALSVGAVLSADAQVSGSAFESKPLVFVSLAPERILDTRNGTGAAAPGKVAAGQVIELHVAPRTLSYGATIPTNAVAVMVNATITESTNPTFVTFFPRGQTRPDASSLNAVFGANSSGLGSENVPNMITVQLGTGGDVSIFNYAGATHVLADVAGYFLPAGAPGTGAGGGTLIAGGDTDPTGACTDGELFLNITTGELFVCAGGTFTSGGTLPGAVNGDLPAPPATPALVPLTGTAISIGTFTAPADGDYLLSAAVNARLTGTPALATVAALAEVECAWNVTGAPTFGESLTLDLTVLTTTIQGLDRGSFPADAHALGLTAGATVGFTCSVPTAIGIGVGGTPGVTITAVLSGIQVNDPS